MRHVLSIVGALALILTSGSRLAWASPAATTTTLAVSANGSAVTTVPAGTVVTLTATVTAGATPVSPGQVNFCDAAAAFCQDIHIVGTAQLTAAGTAVVKFRPGLGSHSYKAVFVGTKTYASSISSIAAISVNGPYPTSTAIHPSGGPGAYSVTAAVTGLDLFNPSATGTVSFLDTSNGNAELGSATLFPSTAAISFLNSANPEVGKQPEGIVVADFDGDGILDWATLNYDSQTITVLLGNGDGTFRAAASIPVGPIPTAFTVADFNGDGIPDLAVVYDNGYVEGAGTPVTILIGKGNGTFVATPTSPSVGNKPVAIVAGDFNGDGIPDLAVANQIDGTISILLGNGDGNFTASPASSATGNLPTGIAAADFNGDGNLDLAVSNLGADTVTILLGKGDGTFRVKATLSTGVYPYTVVAADLNQDGIPDLLVLNNDSKMNVLLGVGDGTFKAAPSPGSLASLVVADLNGDGVPDLAGTSGAETIVFLGKGDGTFSVGPTYTPSHVNSYLGFFSIAAGDFNGDGVSDLAMAGEISYGVAPNGQSEILLSASGSSASASVSLTVGPGPHQIEASYPGDSTYSPSISAAATLTGKPVSTALTFAVSTGPYAVGQSVTLTATLNPYTAAGYNANGELVSFYNGNTLLGTGALAGGVATFSFNLLAAPGQYALKARYAGDSIFASSISGSDLVTGRIVTTLALGGSAGLSFGKTTTLTATLSPFASGSLSTNNNSISFYNGSTLLGKRTLSGGIAILSSNSLPAGEYSIQAVYAGDSDFLPTNSNTISFSVTQVTPAIHWPAPEAITYGTALSATQLDATSVPGSFAYTPAIGSVLGVGSHKLSVTFTPADTTDYTTATATVQLTVNKAVLTVIAGNATRVYRMANPAFTDTIAGFVNGDPPGVVTGAAIIATTANIASHAGTYPITLAQGTLAAANYTFNLVNGTLSVTQAKPAIAWKTPAAIIYGTSLSATQLNATANIAGTFGYNPALGSVLDAGDHTLQVVFTPTDTIDYSTATTTVKVLVDKAPLTVTANNLTRPFDQENQALTAAITGLVNGDSKSVVAGQPDIGTPANIYSGIGPYPIRINRGTLTAANYSFTVVNGTLTITKAKPAITWPPPLAITYGKALGTAQLDASTAVAGKFVYSQADGTILGVGAYTLTATFTPHDTTDYASVTESVTLTVGKATPAITWIAPASIAYGTALSATQLDASSKIPGTVAYSPAAGTILHAGMQKLLVTFTPTDAADYTTASTGVQLTVNQVTPTITWATPAAITYGMPLTGDQLNPKASVAGKFAYTPADHTILGVGEHQLSATFTPTDAVDYTTATATVNLVVTQAILTVRANNAQRLYGAANPAFTDTITGFVAGDTASTAITGAASLTTIATLDTPIGSYAIDAAAGTLASINYSFRFETGTLKVLPLGQTATPAFSPASGATSATAITVTISDTTPGAVIYHSTSSTATPPPPSTKYTGPISVTASETIKAVALAPGYTQSAPAKATYTIL